MSVTVLQSKRLTRRAALAGLVSATLAAGLTACASSVPTPAATAQPPATKPAGAPTALPQPPAPPKATAAPPKVAARTKFKAAMTFKQLAFMPTYLGRAKGFHEEQGIDLDIQHVEADTTIVKGLVASEFDGTASSSTGMLSAIGGGAPIKILGSFFVGNLYLLYANARYGSIAELDGKTLSISSPGSGPYVVAQALFEQAGLDFGKLNFASAPNTPARLQSVSSGSADATVLPADVVALAEQTGGIKVLMAAADKLPNWVNSATSTNEQTLKEKSDLLAGWLTAEMKSIRYALEHRDELLDFAAKELATDRAALAKAFDWYVRVNVWNPNVVVDPAKLEYMQNLNVRMGNQKQAVPISSIYAPEVAEKALAAAGRYQAR